jgi:hypothetical protein
MPPEPTPRTHSDQNDEAAASLLISSNNSAFRQNFGG